MITGSISTECAITDEKKMDEWPPYWDQLSIYAYGSIRVTVLDRGLTIGYQWCHVKNLYFVIYICVVKRRCKPESIIPGAYLLRG